MARRRIGSQWRTRVLLTALLVLAGAHAGRARAALESVLDLAPADAVAVVRVRDLQALSDNVDAFAAAVLPAQMDASDVLARTLAGFVGAGFTSLDDLSEDGLRLDTGVAFVFREVNLDGLTAIIGVSDEDAARANLLSHMEGEAREYEGLAYTESAEGSFAIVDGFLAFSTSVEGLLPLLDVARGAAPSMGASMADAGRARALLDSDGDISIYLHVDAAESTLLPKLEEMVSDAAEGADEAGDGPSAGMSGDDMEQALASLRMMATDVDELGVSLSIDETAISWVSESVVRPGSAWAEAAGLPNVSLQGVTSLPGDAFMVASSSTSGRAMQMSMEQSLAGTPEALVEAFAAAMGAIPADYAGEVTTAVWLSETVMVDAVFVAPLNGGSPAAFEQALSGVVDALVTVISDELEDSEEFEGEIDIAEMVEEAEAEYALGSITGWHVALPAEIFEDGNEAAAALLPQRVGLWQSVVDGNAYIVLAPTPEAAAALIEGYLEPVVTVGERLPDSLRGVLAEDGSAVAVLSLNMLFKGVVRIAGAAVPEMQAFGAFVNFLPDEYGIAAVTSNRGDGQSSIGAIDAAGLAPLVQFGAMAFASMRMPGR